MNRQTPLPDDADAERALQLAFSDLKKRKGPCPSGDEIDDYLKRELSEERRKVLEEHVALCGPCELIVERAKSFGLNVAEEADEESGKGWEEFAAATGVPGSSQAREPRPLYRLPRLFMRPGFAWTAAAVLALSTYLGFSRRETIPSPVVERAEPRLPVMASARLLRLPDTRNPSAGPTRLGLDGNERYVVLAFFYPVRSVASYKVVLRDRSSGAAVMDRAVEPADPLGNFYLIVDAEGLSSGGYVLQLWEPELNAEAESPAYAFEFQLERRAR